MRIREAQKHTDSMDPDADPAHCHIVCYTPPPPGKGAESHISLNTVGATYKYVPYIKIPSLHSSESCNDLDAGWEGWKGFPGPHLLAQNAAQGGGVGNLLRTEDPHGVHLQRQCCGSHKE